MASCRSIRPYGCGIPADTDGVRLEGALTRDSIIVHAVVRPASAMASPLRRARRLSDRVAHTFHHACDEGDLVVAGQLIGVLEMIASRAPGPEDGSRRRARECLVAAHERLWHLRHPHN